MMTTEFSENILVGGLEGGGTKFNCFIGYANGDIIARKTFPTTNPQTTLGQAAAFFNENTARYGPLKALGIGQFGPIEINRASEYYGKILATVKLGWSYIDIVGYFAARLDCPIAFQSDVNVAAVGEHHFGAAKAIDNFVYVTVGTGIGGGVFINGKLLNDLKHPEIGHMMVPQDLSRDNFSGCCSFHGNCLEGLASGLAIEQRWGKPGDQLAQDHPAWELEADYLAILCMNLTCCYAPQKIILGGGVMTQKQIFPLLKQKFRSLLQGYLAIPSEHYIIPTSLGNDAAIKGALILAHQAYLSHSPHGHNRQI